MTDLTKGIIELDRITITRETTREELVNAYKDIVNPHSSTRLVDINTIFYVLTQPFICLFSFSIAGNIHSIQLIPVVDYKSEKGDRSGRQEERRQVCDKWLFDQLGAPHKVINGDIDYHYEGVYIGSFSDFDVRNDYNGGKITIVFEN